MNGAVSLLFASAIYGVSLGDACVSFAANQSEQAAGSPEVSRATAAYRRGDPWGEQAALPQVVVALPPQVTRDDVIYWLWLTGYSDVSESTVANALRGAQARNDAMRATRFPAIFSSAIQAAAPPERMSLTEATALARSIAEQRNRIMREDTASLSELFDALSAATDGAVEPSEWAALRQIDLGPLFPDSLPAARMDWGRTLFRLISARHKGPLSAAVAQLLRDAVPALAMSQTQLVRATSNLIAAEVRWELTAAVHNRGGDAGATDVEEAHRALRSAQRRFAALAVSDAEANEVTAESVAAVMGDVEGERILQAFRALAYGSLATPALDGNWLRPLILGIADEEIRRHLEALLQEWEQASEDRKSEVHQVIRAYRRARLSHAVDGPRLWERTAQRLSHLHGTAESTLLALTSIIVSHTPPDRTGAVIAEVDRQIGKARARLADQLAELGSQEGMLATEEPPASGNSGEVLTPENLERARRGSLDPSRRPMGG